MVWRGPLAERVPDRARLPPSPPLGLVPDPAYPASALAERAAFAGRSSVGTSAAMRNVARILPQSAPQEPPDPRRDSGGHGQRFQDTCLWRVPDGLEGPWPLVDARRVTIRQRPTVRKAVTAEMQLEMQLVVRHARTG